MSAYRAVWRTVVAALAVAAFVAGGSSLGWPAMVCAVAVFAIGGSACGFAWAEESMRRVRSIVAVSVSFGIAATLILGLPELLGPWSMLAVVGVIATCPVLVDWVVLRRQRERQVESAEQAGERSVRELEQQWLRTGWALRNRAAGPDGLAAIVEERAILLDELERRDPRAFELILIRAGWREVQDH